MSKDAVPGVRHVVVHRQWRKGRAIGLGQEMRAAALMLAPVVFAFAERFLQWS